MRAYSRILHAYRWKEVSYDDQSKLKLNLVTNRPVTARYKQQKPGKRLKYVCTGGSSDSRREFEAWLVGCLVKELVIEWENSISHVKMTFKGWICASWAKIRLKNANFWPKSVPTDFWVIQNMNFSFFICLFFLFFYGFLPIDFWCGPWASMNRWPTGPAGTAPTRFGLPSEGTPLGLGTLLCLSPQWERAFSIRGQTAESRPTREAITDDHPTSWPVRVG